VSLIPFFRVFLLIILTFAGATARANDVSGVVVTLRPLHSIVAFVMNGISQPHLLFLHNQSSHTSRLKPSQIRALSSAKILFRISEILEIGVDNSKHIFSNATFNTPLIRTSGLALWPLREINEHGADHKGKHGKSTDNGTDDPHIWLNPQNALILAHSIADKLSATDPENEYIYRKNATSFSDEIHRLTIEIEKVFLNVENRNYISFHDGFQYFEKRFHLNRHASFLTDPNRPASAAHLRELQQEISDHSINCILTEPQMSDKLVHALNLPKSVKVVSADLLGQDLKPGKRLYFQLLRNLSAALKTCLE